MARQTEDTSGYFTDTQLITLREMAAGKRIYSPKRLGAFLADLNRTLKPPIFNEQPNMGDLAGAWRRNMTGLVVPGSIAPWVRAQQGGIPAVVARLHQSMVDIYQDPKTDPTGMTRTGQLLDALQGTKPKDDVQAMFVAMFNDLRQSDPILASQLLAAARADYQLRTQPTEIKLPKVSEFIGHGLPGMVKQQSILVMMG